MAHQTGLPAPAAPLVRHALEVSAAGGHHLCLTAPPARHWLAGTAWTSNADVSPAALRTRFAPDPDAAAWLDDAIRHGWLTLRGAATVARVAWTLADLAARARPTPADMDTALALHRPDHNATQEKQQ